MIKARREAASPMAVPEVVEADWGRLAGSHELSLTLGERIMAAHSLTIIRESPDER